MGGFNLVSLLQAADYEVIVPPEFVCCGIPLISGGFEKDAQENALINAKTIAHYTNQGLPILTVCPSYRLMLTKESLEFFPEIQKHLEKAQIWSAEEFILQLLATKELDIRNFKSEEQEILYHAPCHLRALGGGLPGLELLSQIPGLNISEAQAGCCGISGSYGFKKEKYAIAQSVGAELFKKVQESTAKIVVTECGTCRLQISAHTKKPILHPLTIVRASLEGEKL